MIQGVLQRLSIVQQTKTQLVLRELPLLDWAVAIGLVLIALILAQFGIWISVYVAFGLSIYFLVQGRIRIIRFDIENDRMVEFFQTPLRQEGGFSYELDTIQRAYVYKGDDSGTQVVLVMKNGEEVGLSVYSQDTTAWKDDIVFAINAILYEARKPVEDD